MKQNHSFSKSIKLLGFLALSISLLGLQSCLKDLPIDNNSLGWKPSFAAPLAAGKITLKDLLLKADTSLGVLKENSDKSLVLIYKSDLLSQNGKSSLVIPNETDVSPPIKFGISLPKDTVITKIIFDTLSISLPDAGNSTISKLFFRSGILQLNVTSTFHDTININIDIPDLKMPDGSAFHLPVRLDYAANLPIPLIDNKLIDMSKTILTPKAGNKVPYTITVILKRHAVNPTSLNDQVNTKLDIANITFSRVEGIFQGLKIPIPADSISIGAFKNPLSGKINLANPQIVLDFKNSFGIPLTLQFKKFDAKLANGTTMSAVIPHISDSVKLNIPAFNAPLGQSEETIFTLDKNNSNIVPIVNGVPNKFSYNIVPKIGSLTGFIADTSSINVSLETILPLDLSITNLVMRDTIPLSKIDTTQIKNAESGNFRLTTVNKFPFGIDMQVYFYNKVQNKITDSLSSKGASILLKSAVPSADKKSNIASTQLTDFPMTQIQLIHLSQADHLLTKVIVNTYKDGNGNQPDVIFYSDSDLKINAGILISKVDALKVIQHK